MFFTEDFLRSLSYSGHKREDWFIQCHSILYVLEKESAWFYVWREDMQCDSLQAFHSHHEWLRKIKFTEGHILIQKVFQCCDAQSTQLILSAHELYDHNQKWPRIHAKWKQGIIKFRSQLVLWAQLSISSYTNFTPIIPTVQMLVIMEGNSSILLYSHRKWLHTFKFKEPFLSTVMHNLPHLF